MRKMLTILTAVLLLSSAAAIAADTSNWSVKLAFSSAGAADVMEVTIGEGTASEMLKPPPLPGKIVTGDSANAIVNAYAYMRTTQKNLAKSILAPDETAAAMVWEIKVESEETGPVYVTPDLASKSSDSNMKYFIIDPSTGDTKNLLTDLVGGKVEVFNSDGQPKTLFAMAGTSETFAVVDPAGSIVCSAPNKDIASLDDYSGTDIYINDAKVGTTDADGKFVITGLGALSGNQTVKLDAKYALASISSIDVTNGVGVVALKDLRRCDFKDDETCNFDDFMILKSSYKTIMGGQPDKDGYVYNEAADPNKDGIIDFEDFMILKSHYKETGD